MVSSVSSSRFSLMMFGSGTTFWANFQTESSKVAEKSSIWQFLGSILQGKAQAFNMTPTECFTGRNRSTASPGLDDLRPQEGGKAGRSTAGRREEQTWSRDGWW